MDYGDASGPERLESSLCCFRRLCFSFRKPVLYYWTDNLYWEQGTYFSETETPERNSTHSLRLKLNYIFERRTRLPGYLNTDEVAQIYSDGGSEE